MIPASRLRLKRSTGWFAAGHEVAAALPLLSDAAFRLYVFLCLNVDRHSAPLALARICPPALSKTDPRMCLSLSAEPAPWPQSV
jgi:hypothetical protein